MQSVTQTLRRAPLCALALALAPWALAQTDKPANSPTPPANDSEVVMLDEVVVVGVRASLISALETKRETLSIVDSIVADDIGKFPDLNLAEAMQRISGIQIERDFGEGGSVTIRGLTQMQTNLNGREVFTGSGRGLTLMDIPTELLAGVDVYKTPSANQIEGGLGGSVDVRTRRPFDFGDLQLRGNVKYVYGDLIDEFRPQYSGLFSNTWKTRYGKFGALVSAAQQERSFRQDRKSTGSPIARTDSTSGATIMAPNGTTEFLQQGWRTRTGVNSMLQWAPTNTLEFFLEGNLAKLSTTNDQSYISVVPPSNAAPIAGSVVLFDGPSTYPGAAAAVRDVRALAFRDVAFTTSSNSRDVDDEMQQIAAGGKLKLEQLTLTGDAAYTKSNTSLFLRGVNLSGTAPLFTQDLSSKIPTTSLNGIDLLDPANYRVSQIAYTHNKTNGDEYSAKLDATYRLSTPVIQSLQAGVRYADHTAESIPVSSNATWGASAVRPATAVPNLVSPFALMRDYFPNAVNTPMLRSFLATNPAVLRDTQAMNDARVAFGASLPNLVPNAWSIYKIEESTDTAYAMATFDTRLGVRVDGNVGVRVIRTNLTCEGFTRLSGVIAPIDIDKTYTDTLPSLNARFHLTDDTMLRFSASRSMTRPSFNDLRPSVSLTYNPINPLQSVGGTGNPDLDPMRADQLDLSLEKYFSPTTFVYVAGFAKDVKGFTIDVTQTEEIDGLVYGVRRPYNQTKKSKIRGFEAGYQQFFDFLPGAWSGFGTQVNYTYVDSETPSTSVIGLVTPLPNLSRNSYNVVLMYERAKLSARLAYNWRDSYFMSVQQLTGYDPLLTFRNAYGWLDASVSYQLTPRVKLTLDGTNLLRSAISSYYNDPRFQHEYMLDDRQVIVSCSIRL